MEKAKKLHRFAANIIDYTIINGVLGVIGNTFGLIFGLMAGLSGMDEDWMIASILLVLLLISFVGIYFYYVYFPLKYNGQTLGKKLLKLHIIREDGKALTKKTLIIREMVGKCFLSGLLLYIPFLLIFGEKRQCMHDKMVKTIVVSEK